MVAGDVLLAGLDLQSVSVLRFEEVFDMGATEVSIFGQSVIK